MTKTLSLASRQWPTGSGSSHDADLHARRTHGPRLHSRFPGSEQNRAEALGMAVDQRAFDETGKLADGRLKAEQLAGSRNRPSRFPPPVPSAPAATPPKEDSPSGGPRPSRVGAWVPPCSAASSKARRGAQWLSPPGGMGGLATPPGAARGWVACVRACMLDVEMRRRVSVQLPTRTGGEPGSERGACGCASADASDGVGGGGLDAQGGERPPRLRHASNATVGGPALRGQLIHGMDQSGGPGTPLSDCTSSPPQPVVDRQNLQVGYSVEALAAATAVANRQPLVLSRRAPASSSSSTSPLAVLDLCLSALPPTTPDCLPRRVHSAQRPSSVSGARLAAQLRCVRRRGSHARTRPPAWASSPSRTVGDVVQLQRAASAPVRCSRTPRAPPGLGDETERIALLRLL
ncbi:hypothetical protein ACCO45_009278 [Purpureocillium lilacinum]|uniref:Uncharacterized protein n=1 Tax=Purpureocillium lilacinum TaxID=33203 RepID=A0ACC4DKS1_PURLI